MQVLENGFDDTSAVLVIALKNIVAGLRTTNGVEHLNEEIRHRENGLYVFSPTVNRQCA